MDGVQIVNFNPSKWVFYFNRVFEDVEVMLH